MAQESKWQHVSRRIAPILGARQLRRAWRVLETSLLSGPVQSASAEITFLATAASVATAYEEHSLAVAWIEKHQRYLESKGLLTSVDLSLYNVVRFQIEVVAKNSQAAQQLFDSIDWKSVPPLPWVVSARLYHAAHANRRQWMLDLLRRPSPCFDAPPEPPNPGERATWLCNLGEFEINRGRWARARGFLKAALSGFSTAPGIQSRLREISAQLRMGVVARFEGRAAEAEECCIRAIAAAKQLGHRGLLDEAMLDLASFCTEREEFARAEELLLSVVKRIRRGRKELGFSQSHLLHAFIRLANNAIDAEDAQRAASYIRSAERCIRHVDRPRFRGLLHISRGRLLSLRGPEAACAAALAEFDEAERNLKARGDGDVQLLAFVQLYRGQVHLKLRNVMEAMKNVRLSLSSEQLRTAAGSFQAKCLLLKSQILLTNQAPRPDQLYEEVLGGLGLARNPIVLFKIVANLYLYTWELDQSHLDLTDYHLRQVNRMAEVLDRQTFERLYQEHVTAPVVRRVFGRSREVKEPLVN